MPQLCSTCERCVIEKRSNTETWANHVAIPFEVAQFYLCFQLIYVATAPVEYEVIEFTALCFQLIYVATAPPTATFLLICLAQTGHNFLVEALP